MRRSARVGGGAVLLVLGLGACTGLRRPTEPDVEGGDGGPEASADAGASEGLDAGVSDAAIEGGPTSVDLEWAMWPLPPPSPDDSTYTLLGATVHDEVTGLLWERTAPSSFATWVDARARCEGLSLEGHDDFRLPTRIELLGLLDLTREEPGFNPSAFPAAPAGPYWTATPDARAAGRYWITAIGTASSRTAPSLSTARARCVRGTPPPQEHYVTQGMNAVKDVRTGLIWAKGVAAPTPVTWTDALLTCQQRSPPGGLAFRLPNARELESLVDVRATAAPTLDAALGAEGPGPTWTITDEVGVPANAVVVDFSIEHDVASLRKSGTAWVRCVGGP